ncbi:asparagine synthase (glutamine-hydrolyzing) [Candidatus Methylomirabilis sp.]|uniref:asparagine synthase (glutamine-hydrolyzing) n=1 Tax=Candidatus Methylomirabilis sp. TaxID=2032687 RepID=UPI002A5EF076|nr:asparagine synthase (glutamine-hydrolyzing) [Candidatus Methylomirabilis sp.]
MSGIVGIWNLDGHPVNKTVLMGMSATLAHRGPDGEDLWVQGSVGLGHRMLHTTPESLLEKQPLVDETGKLCLTLDGRVDNREELRAALEAKGATLRTDTDAELVLRAYEVWGEDCPQRILGDFAFAIWDGRSRQLFCARDILGIKPFYYYADGCRFLFASALRPLFENPAVPREPNEGMVGEYLATNFTSQQETLYRGILRLPPAQFLIVQPDKIRMARYWDVDPDKAIRHGSDDAYAEEFLEIFKRAVRCRLRSHRLVGADLSGGLDSSSVVCVAHSLYREGVVANPGLETFSLLFPGLPCDESAYIRDVTRMWEVKSNAVAAEETAASRYAEEVTRYHDCSIAPNTVMHDPAMILAQEMGVRVLLTGQGSDEWLTGDFLHHADFLRRCRIADLVRQARFDSQVLSNLDQSVSPLFMITRYGLWPFLPRPVQRAVKWALRREPNDVPPWIDPTFARRIQLAERFRKKDSAGRQFPTFVQAELSSALTSGDWCFSYEFIERYGSSFGLEYRHPFLDRRMIEYALALPEEQRWRRDHTKFVLRQAMQGLLPETVRQRRTKGNFAWVFLPALAAQADERFFDSLSIAAQGWVNTDPLRPMYRHMVTRYASGAADCSKYMWSLWMIFNIELWFKTIFLGGVLVSPRVGRGQEAAIQPPI